MGLTEVNGSGLINLWRSFFGQYFLTRHFQEQGQHRVRTYKKHFLCKKFLPDTVMRVRREPKTGFIRKKGQRNFKKDFHRYNELDSFCFIYDHICRQRFNSNFWRIFFITRRSKVIGWVLDLNRGWKNPDRKNPENVGNITKALNRKPSFALILRIFTTPLYSQYETKFRDKSLKKNRHTGV